MREELTDRQREILRNMESGGWYTAHSLDLDNTELEDGHSAAPDWVKIELRHLAQRGILERVEQGKGPHRWRDGSYSQEKRVPKYRLTQTGEELRKALLQEWQRR